MEVSTCDLFLLMPRSLISDILQQEHLGGSGTNRLVFYQASGVCFLPAR